VVNQTTSQQPAGCAIHSTSLTSVLRPGTCLRWWALTEHLKAIFEQVVDRFPILARAFHCHMSDAGWLNQSPLPVVRVCGAVSARVS